MDKKPILSICIPTWNRWHTLGQVIESVVSQDVFMDGDIEILISDNCSDDNTYSVVQKYLQNFQNIRYYKNETNIWAMPNINKAYSLCSWKYIWCLSSHMKLLSNSLVMILKLINKKWPQLIINKVTSSSMKYDNYEILNIKWQIEDYVYFNNKLKFFNYIGDQLEFDKSSFYSLNNLFSNITCFIFKKEYYESAKLSIVSEKWNDFFNKYNFIHSIIAFYNVSSDIIFNLISIATPAKIAKTDTEKEESTLRNKSDSVYLKDARYLTRYILNNYNCNKNFKKFVKKFNWFWLKLYLISNIPLIWWFKKKIPLSIQEKVWHLLCTAKLK